MLWTQCVHLSKIYILKPCSIMWWYLDMEPSEIISSWRWRLHYVISAHLKIQLAYSLSLCSPLWECIASRKPVCKTGMRYSSEHDHAGIQISNFSTCRTVRNFCCLNYPVYVNLLLQLQITKITSVLAFDFSYTRMTVDEVYIF